MKKTVIHSAKVPETGGPFNLCIRHGNMVYVSGLPPFQEDFCEGLRLARSTGAPLPKYQRKSIEDEARIVMDHLKWLLEEAGSCL
jgi:2-iminobutanoate/2-iminopropanoate deaminase